MAAADLLALIALVVALAVGAEMVGDRLGVPNFLFFILAGIAVGPPGLGLVDHQVFGEGLGVVVGLGVAIIIFHSGSGITVDALRAVPPTVYRLATVGVLVTFLGAAAVAYVAMNVPPGIAVLIGALLVPTGTTVIEPLLSAVPVREELASTLDIEATVTEVSAGILGIAVFYGITLGEPDPGAFVVLFAWHLLSGVAVGLVVAAGAWFMFTVPQHAPERAPRHASQLYLATAVVAFAIAEYVAKEAGVAAVATAGVVLGNADLPYEEHVVDFEEDLTTLIIAFLFVVLASFVEPEWLATVGFAGLVVAVGVVLLVRPLAVFLSTAGSAFSTRDKLFLSGAAPRGIIPAGLATLLAIEIQGSNPEAAAYLTGTVLIVIMVSTAVEGTLAGRFAERLGVTTDTAVVVGGGRLGLALADQYRERGERVILVETDQETLETARSEGFAVYHGDGTDEAMLREAGADRTNRIVAATHDDEVNLAVARLAGTVFDVETVLARVNRGANRQAYEDLGVEQLTGSQLDLWALDHLVDGSAPDWLAALTRTGGLTTVAVSDDDAGSTVGDLDHSLPGRSFVVALTRGEETWVPDRDERLDPGDALTVLGRAEAVEEATARLRAAADP